MAKKKPTAQLTGEQRFNRSMLLIDRGADLIQVLVRMGSLVAIVYFATGAVEDLAGKKTLADIGFGLFTSERLSEAVAWVFGGSGIAYGMQQKRLRSRETKNMGKRLERYETRLDPKRSSSEPEGSGSDGG